MRPRDFQSWITAVSMITSIFFGHGSFAQDLNDSRINEIPIYFNSKIRYKNNMMMNAMFIDLTVCQPATDNCRIVHNVQLDTGSSGLRLFKELLPKNLEILHENNGDQVAACALFQDSRYWGPLVRANVKVGGLWANDVIIHQVDALYPHKAEDCDDIGDVKAGVSTHAQAGIGGILGIAPALNVPANGPFADTYSRCTRGICSRNTLPKFLVENVITKLPQDNNGLIFDLHDSSRVVGEVKGRLILGVNTHPNNQLRPDIEIVRTDSWGRFRVAWRGHVLAKPAIVDSGNAIISIPSELNVPLCKFGKAIGNPTRVCPLAPTTYSFQIADGSGRELSFQLATIRHGVGTSMSYVPRLGDSDPDDDLSFNLGAPFFFDRRTYFVFDQQPAGAFKGPFWAQQ